MAKLTSEQHDGRGTAFMAPDRSSRNGGFSLPAKRNSALATAALASAALLPQSGSAAADEAPSRDEVSRRVTNLYDRAESASGNYNATRAGGRASSKPGRGGAAAGGDRGATSDPALDAIAKQWYGVGRAKLGPFVEAALPSDRVPARPAQPPRQRPSDALAPREPQAERPVPELTARPVLALPSAPETAPAALTAGPGPDQYQSPSWATPDPAPQNLTGTGEMPAIGAAPLDTGFPEYTAQVSTGFPDYSGQFSTGFPEYTGQLTPVMPEYSGQLGTGRPEYTGQLTTALPEYSGQFSTGLPEYTGQLDAGLPTYTGQPNPGLPEYTGFSDYSGQLGTGLPDYSGQFSTGLPDYTAQPTTAFSEYTTQPTPSLTALAPSPLDTTQSVPFIPSPRAPEPEWQSPQPTAAPLASPTDPAPSLPTADPGYDSKVIQVLAFARSQIGKPCVWGAAGPGSYDNSGLTQAAWKVAGVSLPRTSLAQASTGTAVPLYAMQPGDLVFFHDDFSHVGLCTGNGMMIHAPGPGATVREESIYPTGESLIRGAIRPV